MPVPPVPGAVQWSVIISSNVAIFIRGQEDNRTGSIILAVTFFLLMYFVIAFVCRIYVVSFISTLLVLIKLRKRGDIFRSSLQFRPSQESVCTISTISTNVHCTNCYRKSG